MNDSETLLYTNFKDLKLFKRGKVRDIYDVGEYLLIVSTDRISAFDVVMNQGVPFKGKILNKLSEFWFRFTNEIISNHLITTKVDEFPSECSQYKYELEGRSMLVRKTEPILIESVVRGYLAGSAWEEYQNNNTVCGIKLPEGFKLSEKLPTPIWTPSTKAQIGSHDINISEEEARRLFGSDEVEFIKRKSLEVYLACYDYALTRGIIIADTKFEFGKFDDEIILIDEILTPDSSRFWQLSSYESGKPQENLDKQVLRDYLVKIGFNKQPPPPDLPEDLIKITSEKYQEIYFRITGQKLN